MIRPVEGPGGGQSAAPSFGDGPKIDDLKETFIQAVGNEAEGKAAFDNFMMMIYRSIMRKLR